MIASILLISNVSITPPSADRVSWPRLYARAHPDRSRTRRRASCRRGGLVVLVSGHRHELLRIAPHAVLDDVEAVSLLLRLHPQAVHRLDREEDQEAEREDERERRRDAECLHAELLEVAVVDEPRLADAVELGEARRGEEPAGKRSPDPREPVRG